MAGSFWCENLVLALVEFLKLVKGEVDKRSIGLATFEFMDGRGARR